MDLRRRVAQGSKNGAQRLVGWIVKKGFALAAPDYRLSGEATWPAQIDDCKAAVRWLREHGGQYGIDGTRIGVLGDSAGGHLAAMLGTTTEGGASPVLAVCAIFPRPTYRLSATPTACVAELLGVDPQTDPETALQASPIAHVHRRCPPFLLIHGDADELVPLDQSLRLCSELERADVSVRLEVRRGVGHESEKLYADEEVRSAIQAFFREHLRPRELPQRSSPAPGAIAGRRADAQDCPTDTGGEETYHKARRIIWGTSAACFAFAAVAGLLGGWPAFFISSMVIIPIFAAVNLTMNCCPSCDRFLGKGTGGRYCNHCGARLR